MAKQSFETSKTFAGKVLNSTANLASQKVEKGIAVIADKASLAKFVEDEVIAKSKAGAEALGEIVTGIFVFNLRTA